MRNWRSEAERGDLDALIRKVRGADVACARWSDGTIETLEATPVDGSGSQLFLAMSPAGRKAKRLSTIFTKNGISDAATSDPQPRRQLGNIIEAAAEAPLLAVSRGFAIACWGTIWRSRSGAVR